MKTVRPKSAPGNGKYSEELETSIAKMASSGELAKPARLAIRRARRRGLPITFQRDGLIIKQFSNGREHVLGKVDVVDFRIPAGVQILEKR